VEEEGLGGDDEFLSSFLLLFSFLFFSEGGVEGS
jgi:hypothetical protein